jgi:hypothetical protein
MSDPGDKIRLLELRGEDLQRQIDNLRIGVLAVPAVAALIAAIAVPQFRRAESDPEELLTIGGLVGEIDSGFVSTVGVILIVLLVLTGVTLAFAAIDRDPRAVQAATVLGSLAIADWLVLWIAVGNSGGAGTIGGAEFENTLRVLVVPIAAAFALLCARAVRTASDWRRA